MAQFTFILNPKAGRGAGARLVEPIMRELKRRGVDHEFFVTRYAGEAVELSRKAGGRVVVSVGGDGTVNEVANGMHGSGRRLGIIPAGSGNDLIKSINVPKRPLDALECVLNGKPRVIDIGSVRCSGLTGAGGETGTAPARWFVNGVGVGFDAAVAVRMQEIKRLSGTLVYVVAVFRTLGKFTPPDFEIRMDGEISRSRQFLVAVGNGRCAGGGFYLTPDATVDDGMLDVCTIDPVTIPTILRLMPKVMLGKHHDAKQVNFRRCKLISLSSESPFYVHADGEIVGRNSHTVEVEVHPKQLTVITN